MRPGKHFTGPYNYVTGPSTLGIGVDNLALVQPGIAATPPIYGKRYNVQGSFAPLTGAAQFPLNFERPLSSLRQNGVYLSGDMALDVLTQFNRDNKLG